MSTFVRKNVFLASIVRCIGIELFISVLYTTFSSIFFHFYSFLKWTSEMPWEVTPFPVRQFPMEKPIPFLEGIHFEKYSTENNFTVIFPRLSKVGVWLRLSLQVEEALGVLWREGRL